MVPKVANSHTKFNICLVALTVTVAGFIMPIETDCFRLFSNSNVYILSQREEEKAARMRQSIYMCVGASR